jgi:hypothetical protein
MKKNYLKNGLLSDSIIVRLSFNQNKIVRLLFLILFSFLIGNVVTAQATGDYQSNVTAGNWTDVTSWQYYNGTAWVTPSGTNPQGYPGQFAGTGTVKIQSGHTITINSSISPFPFGTLTITGRLTLTGDNSPGGMDFDLKTQSIIVTPSFGFIEFKNKLNLRLPPNTTLQVNSGGLVGDCSAQQSIYIDKLEYAVCKGNTADTGLTFENVMNGGGSLNAIASSNSPVCNGENVGLIGNYSGVIGNKTSGGTAGVNYSWSIKAPNNSITTNPNFVANETGNYLATLTCSTYYGSDLVTNSETISVLVNAKPTPGLTSNYAGNIFCAGTSVTFTATGGTNYNFKVAGSSVQNSATATYTTTTLTNGQIVSVDVTNASGCTTTSTRITNTVKALPNNISDGFSATIICTGESPTLTFDADDTTYSTPYSITYKNDITSIQYTVTIPSAARYTFTPEGYNLNSNTGYSLVSISNATCTNSVFSSFKDSGVNLMIRPIPVATISGSTSLCVGAAPSNITFTNPQTVAVTVTYKINEGADQTVNINASSSSNIAVATSTAGVFIYKLVGVRYQSAASCLNTISGTATVTVSPNLPASVSVAVSPTGAICEGTLVTFTATPTNGGATPTYQWYNGATLINGESAATYATNSLVNADAIKVIMTSNASPCLIDSPATSDPITMIVPAAAVWTGSSWTNGPPTYSQAVIFNETYNSEGDMQACSCQVNAGVVTIKSGHALKITNGIAVSSGSLIFENNASLVQINDAAVNVGAITYQRATTPILDTDYVYWSSPVAGAKLGAIQTATLYYSFYALGNSWVRAYSTTPMAKGIGYIVRGAGTGLSSGPRLVRTATFTGVPNNGINDVNITAGKSNLIGNPYPSAIDADAFLTANKEALQGTLYFWTHQSAIQSAGSITTGTAGSGAYAYTSGDYASYNFTGDVGTAVSSLTGGVAPSVKIAAGQSFLATGSSSGGIARFKNRMRLSKGGETLDNTQFLRTASGSKTSKVTTTNEIEKSRVWLNLSNTQGAFKQMMIGYVTGATNDYDKGYDAVSLNGNAYVDFYSIDNDSLLTIQGRALPIPETDAVPLGFSSVIEGDFTIAIDKTDGLLMGMDVFLEDKNTNTFTNLKAGGYTFSTKKGTYNDRFVLSYTNKTLATADFKDLNYDVLISIKNEIIKIKSKVQLIDKVMVFNVSGKLMLEKKNIESTESILSGTNLSKQLYVIKVFLKDGKIISEKIIY